MSVQAILIDHNNYRYNLDIESFKLSEYLKGKATSLVLSVIAKEIYPGCSNQIELYIDEDMVFNGKIYSYTKKSYGSTMWAYNGLRGFKSTVTGIYKNKKASEIFADICMCLDMPYKAVDTGYVIPYMFYESRTYFDILQDAFEQTKLMTGVDYIFMEKDGTITLIANDKTEASYEVSDSVLASRELEVSREDIVNYVEVYQMSENAVYKRYIEKDDELIEKFGLISKSVKVNLNYTESQCKIIANNYLSEGKIEVYNTEIEVVANTRIYVGDVFLIGEQKFTVTESVLYVDSDTNLYTLTLEFRGV